MLTKKYQKKNAIRKLNRYGMVSTASTQASAAGAKMLEKGGNAIDAGVAAAFCLGVTEPQGSGLGGQSMVLIHMSNNNPFAIDGSSRVPLAYKEEMGKDELFQEGLVASTVPSTPAVLGSILEKYGRLSLKEVLQPSIEVAREGFSVTPLIYSLIQENLQEIKKDPLLQKRFCNGNHSLYPGELLFQPELAACLEQMAKKGWRDFYQGKIALEIVKDMKARGGLIRKKDLLDIPIFEELAVLEGTYRGRRLVTFPPPGAGRVLLRILNMFEHLKPLEIDLESPKGVLFLSKIFQQAQIDRLLYPVGPEDDFVPQHDIMLDKENAKNTLSLLRKQKDSAQQVCYGKERKSDTTHLSAADSEGNVIGITQSIELVFGCKRASKTYGFLYNSYMSVFNEGDDHHPYARKPGNKPWSSVAPTIFYENKKPCLVLGSPGSERISTSIAQVILRYFDKDETLEEAIAAPRFHATSDGIVGIESPCYDDLVLSTLKESGFEILNQDAYSYYLGCVQAVTTPKNDDDLFTGVADPRRDGDAFGPMKYSSS